MADAKSEPPSPAAAESALAAVLGAITGDSLKGLSPARSVEGASFQATITAYRALAEATKEIAAMVHEHKIGAVLLHDSAELPDLAAYRAFTAGTKVLTDRIKQALNPQSGHLSIIAEAGAIVSAGLALASFLLHREIKVTNAAITIDAKAVIAMLEQRLRKEVTISTVPALSVAFTDDGDTPSSGRLRDQMETLEKLGDRLRSKLDDASPHDGGDGKSTPKPPTEHPKTPLESAIKALADFEEATAKNYPQLVRGDEIANFMSGGAALLAIQIFAAGGSTRTETSSLSRDRVEHSGGVIVGARLIDPSGSTLDSKMVIKHIRTEEDDRLDTWQDSGF